MKPSHTPQGARAPDTSPPQDAAAAGAAAVDALEDRFKPVLAQAPYYSAGRHWDDYAPAYRFGAESFQRHGGRRFDEVAPQLEQEWETVRHASRLGWVEARGAVEDAWSSSLEDGVGSADPVLANGRTNS